MRRRSRMFLSLLIVFSLLCASSCAGSFPNAPYLNTGGTLDYTVTVEHYDTVNHEAIITFSGNS